MAHKTPQNLTDAELLKLLQEPNTEPSRPPKTSIKSTHGDLYFFISYFEFERGHNTVAIKALWQLYNEWSKKPVNKRKFVKFIEELFPTNEKDSVAINKGLSDIALGLEEYINSKIKFKVKFDSENKHFTNFLKKHIIQEGKTWVSTTLLFDIYRVWVKRIRKSNTLGFEQFEQFCKHYFMFTETKQLTKVAIDVESIKCPKRINLKNQIVNQLKNP